MQCRDKADATEQNVVSASHPFARTHAAHMAIRKPVANSLFSFELGAVLHHFAKALQHFAAGLRCVLRDSDRRQLHVSPQDPLC